MSEPLWLERRPHPSTPTRTIYRLRHDVPCSDGSSTPWVVVSWGRDNDTQIFPSTEQGNVLDMTGLVKFAHWCWWMPFDEAMTTYLTDPSVRNPFVEHGQEK